MKNNHEDCPLCGKPSMYSYVDRGSRKFYSCEYCTDFQVYVHAEQKLKSISTENKTTLSKASHDSDTNKILFVTLRVDWENPDMRYVLDTGFFDRAQMPMI